jgi:hypothetical protein
MKRFRLLGVVACLFALMCVFPFSAKAEYKEVIAGGASFNPYAAPNTSVSFLYAHQLREGTYSFNMIDIVSITKQPFTVGISATPGIAQHVLTFNGIRVYGVGTLGAVVGGTGDASYSLSGGGTAAIGLGKGFMLMPNFRVLKNGLTDRQYVGGIMLAWGSK